MTADTDQLELEAVVPDGAADEAAWRLQFRRGNTRPLWSGLLLVGSGVGLSLATGRPAWLLLGAVWLVVGVAGYGFNRSWMRTVALRAGSSIRVSWGRTEVSVRRPSSTIVFQYADMEVAGRTDLLTMLWVRNVLGSRSRQLLFLPHSLVPPEAVARFAAVGTAGPDPFGGAELPHVTQMSGTFAHPFRHGLSLLSLRRRLLLAAVVVLEACCLAVLVSSHEWKFIAVILALLAGAAWLMRTPFQLARRRLPAGSVVGVDLTPGRVVLALPALRVDLPESRLRNVLPCGPDLVLFQIRGMTGQAFPVPRVLVPDAEIDRLRAVCGRRPMRPSQRLGITSSP